MPVKALAWLLLPLVGLFELCGHFYFATRAPALDEWRSARPAVTALRKADEVVVVAPLWAEPNARAAFGDDLMPLAHVGRADVTGFARAIEVSTLGQSAPDLAGWQVVEEQRHGKLRLRVVENPRPAKTLFSFIDHVPDARVFDVGANGEEPCRWNTNARRSAGGLHGHPAYPAKRHSCRGAQHHFVGVTVVEDENWKPRRCIWAHPVRSKTLVIAYDDVPMGKTVRGYGTIPWWLEREKKGAPVELEVRIAGDTIGTYVHSDGDPWEAFEFPTGRPAGSRGRVELLVRAERAKQRQFCFTAEMR